MSARAVPFYCPYCGEETLVPEVASGGTRRSHSRAASGQAVPDVPEGATGEGHGHWACRSCRRSFRLSLTALASATTITTTGPAPTAPEENG
jgi:transposase-like protein